MIKAEQFEFKIKVERPYYDDEKEREQIQIQNRIEIKDMFRTGKRGQRRQNPHYLKPRRDRPGR